MTDGVPHLSDRINDLFARIPPPDAANPEVRYSTSRAAREITESGTAVTDVYLGKLRNGSQNNPSFRHLGAIADLFGVPVDYFHSEEVAAKVIDELDTLQVARSAQISGILGRSHDRDLQFGLAQIKAIVAAMEQSQRQGDSDEDPKTSG